MDASGSGSGTARGREGGLDRLELLRRELELRLTVAHPLDVYTGLLSVQDRGHDYARAAGVEQRERARLATRHLAVGVVADEAGVGERAVYSPLRRDYALIEAAEYLLDPVAQLNE